MRLRQLAGHGGKRGACDETNSLSQTDGGTRVEENWRKVLADAELSVPRHADGGKWRKIQSVRRSDSI